MSVIDKAVEWARKHPDKVVEIIRAEELVRNGKIELVYQNGKYIGCDIQQRIRGKRCS